MQEKLNSQINELEQILKGINELDESIDTKLKENKYTKKLTEKYFNNNENIIQQIKNSKLLIKELKDNHIKITENQKQLENKYNEYIKNLSLSLNKILKLMKNLVKEKTYIDSEIIEILELNEPEDLKEVILFNKKINLKKKGLLEDKKTEQKPKKTKSKLESKKLDNKKIDLKEKTEIPIEIIKQQEKKKDEIKEEVKQVEPEIILVFKDRKEIDEHLKKEYNIEITSEKTVEELNGMIEIIENEPFKIDDSDLIKTILETSDFERLVNLKEYFKKAKSNVIKLKYIKDLYDTDELVTHSTVVIINSNTELENKIELLKKSKERKKIIVKNRIVTLLYGMGDIPITLLLKRIDEEKLDQVIELGHIKELYRIIKYYQQTPESEEQLQDTLEKIVFRNISKYFFDKTIYNEPDNKVTDAYKMIREVTSNNDLKKALKKFQNMIETNREKKSVVPLATSPKAKISNNPILKIEEETSKKAKENFKKAYLTYQYDKSPINIENNMYIESLKTYTNNGTLTYSIPIKKVYCKNNRIEISKQKFTRLINQHILEGHEITPELIKQCMFYNLMITDELLEELDNVLTEHFNKLDQKTKKY